MQSPPPVPALSIASCRSRQQRLCAAMAQLDLSGAVISDRRHVHYFTGHWGRGIHSPVLWISREGATVLALPMKASEPLAVDEIRTYHSNDYFTLVDDQRGQSLASLRECWQGHARLGADRAIWPTSAGEAQFVDVMPMLRKLRRTKDADEVALLQCALDASEAGYAHVRSVLEPGMLETTVWSQLQEIFTRQIGETLGEMGNDFQVGSLGNAPRRRAIEAGETAIYDFGVIVRGYNGDMCRTFVVGGKPSPAQLAAHERILETLAFIEQTIEPGYSCRLLFEQTQKRLDGFDGLEFKHHLGHGIGLNPHEAPRLNPMHDDVFQIGDVFTCEPGLYGPPLRVGIRIEHAYHLTEAGLIRLTNSSTDLV